MDNTLLFFKSVSFERMTIRLSVKKDNMTPGPAFNHALRKNSDRDVLYSMKRPFIPGINSCTSETLQATEQLR